MKKFFSLMLVAVLLVSALPFQAFAAGTGEVIPNAPATTTCGTKTTGHVWTRDPSNDVAATCTADGKEAYKCTGNPTECAATGYKVVTAEGHKPDWSKATVTKQPTCTDTGYETSKCLNCESIRGRDIPALGHDWDNGVVTKAATCHNNGERTYTCKNGCGSTNLEEIPATGNHTYNAAGVCTVCGGTDNLSRTNVTFIIDNVAGVSKIYTQTFIDGRTLAVPTAELISNYEFKGWYPAPNGSGNPIVSGNTWDEDTMPDTYYAWYVYNPNKDGMSTVTVTARCYIDGIGSSYLDVPVLTQALPDNTNVFEWLTNNKNTTILNSVYAKVDTTKYEWKDRYFYNHNGTEVLTEQTVFADGPKAILIKLVEKDNTTRANVQLYLHTSTTAENPFRILDMNGYTSGMNVTRTAAANLVKEYYSYKTIGNLFTQSDWNALQNGENVAGRTSVYIADNGTYKIHVVVTNASSKSSSNADTTNPKTGDYITIAVGTMVMAAAAFITLAEMKKRKMI